MSQKRFWWSVFMVWIVINVTSWFFHSVWLAPLYQETAQFWRSPEDMQQWMWMIWVGHLAWSWAFVWIWSKGLSDKNPWWQAVRYAGAIIMLSQIPQQMGVWATTPYPLELVMKW